MLEILDFKKEEFVGKQVNKISLVIDDNNNNVYYENFLTDQNLYKSERTIKTIKGKTINALVTRSVLAIEGRELALTSFVDITSVKAAEKKIIDSNKITSDFKTQSISPLL
jgi:PAS domain S-box-containing protein